MAILKEFKYFTIFNHEDEEEYLRNKHKNGWKFIKVTGLGTYHFESCDPEDVIYQLDYNQTDQKDEYIQMFSDCEWEYIQDFVQYSYFRKSLKDCNENESIFCDEQSRLEMLERVYKGRLLPIFVIFMCVILPQFILALINQRYIFFVLMGGLLFVYVSFFIYCANHYYKKKNG